MLNKYYPIDIQHLSAYAEDPGSYCYYKGVPRSVHNKSKIKNKSLLKNPLYTSSRRIILYITILTLVTSIICLYIYSSMPIDGLEIPFEKTHILYAAIGFFALTIVLWLIRSFFVKRALFKLCGVRGSGYRLLGSSLTWPGRAIKLKYKKLRGTPSTVFMKKSGKSAYVCQYNPRMFNGRPKVRERYQMLLFMGITMEEYKLENIKGAIRYNDHLEVIKYDPIIYNKLLGITDEYKQAISEWVTPDSRPLFKRDNVF